MTARDVVAFLALWIGYSILIWAAVSCAIAAVRPLRAWAALVVRRRKTAPEPVWYPAIEPPSHLNCRCSLAYNPATLHPLHHPTFNVDATNEAEAWATIARGVS